MKISLILKYTSNDDIINNNNNNNIDNIDNNNVDKNDIDNDMKHSNFPIIRLKCHDKCSSN